MIGAMVELHIGQPRVPILVPRNRWVVFFLRCAGKTVGGWDAVNVNAFSQPVNALTVGEIRSAELKIPLCRSEGALAALGDAFRRQDKSVGDNGRAAAARRADETDIGMG